MDCETGVCSGGFLIIIEVLLNHLERIVVLLGFSFKVGSVVRTNLVVLFPTVGDFDGFSLLVDLARYK